MITYILVITSKNQALVVLRSFNVQRTELVFDTILAAADVRQPMANGTTNGAANRTASHAADHMGRVRCQWREGQTTS